MNMASKRPGSPQLIENPLIKKRNLNWTLDTPISPPQLSKPSREEVSTAALEAGESTTSDPLEIFSDTLSKHAITSQPTLPISTYASLYTSNANSPRGAHFVIHQHDHPIAGTHYDLRLQINRTSSVSWAIMYGLPGDGNSVRPNRNATETRVHCLWNHLIETASSKTGSLLIWDTGTYSILPRTSKYAPKADPDSQQTSSPEAESTKTQQDLLHEAFQNRKIKLQLHGSKLPKRYILNLRLTKDEDVAGRIRTPSKRRRRRRGKPAGPEPSSSGDEEEEDPDDVDLVPQGQEADNNIQISAMEKELREMEDDEIRRTNAYSGAENTIGSVHQRRWYLSLDRSAVGYRKGKGGKWFLDASDWDEDHGSMRLTYPFYVKGVEEERSVVTGRKGEDVLRDEGVEGHVGRKGWKPVLN